MYRLVITAADLRAALRLLQRGGAVPPLAVEVLYVREGVELLARVAAEPERATAAGTLALTAAGVPTPEAETATHVRVRLELDWRARPGRARGWVRWGPEGAAESLDELRIAGPGLAHYALRPSPLLLPPAPPEPGPDLVGMRSRVDLALGTRAVDALQGLCVAVVGCGGLGSTFAEHLARVMGHGGCLLLMDPDTLAPWNLPAWTDPALGAARLGAAKAEVLAERLRALPEGPLAQARTLSALDGAALAPLKAADVIACCVDHPGPRLACGFFAAILGRPLLVIETGVFSGDGPEAHAENFRKIFAEPEKNGDVLTFLLSKGWTRQADVRLIPPGECLLCAGGVGGDPAGPETGRPFLSRRLGTLGALNLEAVGRALRLLFAFLGGDAPDGPAHLQLDERISGIGEWRQVSHRRRPGCPLCARTLGGDRVREEFREVLEEYRQQTTGG